MDYIQSSASENLLTALIATVLIMATGFFAYWMVKGGGARKVGQADASKAIYRKTFTKAWARRIRFFWLALYIYLGFILIDSMYSGNLGLAGILFFIIIPVYVVVFRLLLIPWEQKGDGGIIVTILFTAYFILSGLTSGGGPAADSGPGISERVPEIFTVVILYISLFVIDKLFPNVVTRDKRSQGTESEPTAMLPPYDDSQNTANTTTQPAQAAEGDSISAQYPQADLPRQVDASTIPPADQSTNRKGKQIAYYVSWIVLSIVVIGVFFDALWYSTGKPFPGHQEMLASAALRGTVIASIAMLAQLYLGWQYGRYNRHNLWRAMMILPAVGLFLALVSSPADLLLFGLYVLLSPLVWLAIAVKGIAHLTKHPKTTNHQ